MTWVDKLNIFVVFLVVFGIFMHQCFKRGGQ